MTEYLPIGGTGAAKHVAPWYKSGSAFDERARAADCRRSARKFRLWSTALAGRWHCGANQWAWSYGGDVLRDYLTREVKYANRNIIAHSHGGQIVPYALAGAGLQIRRLVTVGTPIRPDMLEVWQAAAQNIGCHLHLYGTGWGSRMRVFGSAAFGVSFTRKHPTADASMAVAGGHSGILHAAPYLDQTSLIFRFLKTESLDAVLAALRGGF